VAGQDGAISKRSRCCQKGSPHVPHNEEEVSEASWHIHGCGPGRTRCRRDGRQRSHDHQHRTRPCRRARQCHAHPGSGQGCAHGPGGVVTALTSTSITVTDPSALRQLSRSLLRLPSPRTGPPRRSLTLRWVTRSTSCQVPRARVPRQGSISSSRA